MKNPFMTMPGRYPICGAVLSLLLLGACTPAQPGKEFNDPYEAQNRATHESNVDLNTAVFGGKNTERHRLLPVPVSEGLANFADNLDMPGAAVNHVLQGRPGIAVENVARFAVNSTIGLAGIFDPAAKFGLPDKDTDFGETLYRWGAPEGAFLVVPFLGPTTERDFGGMFVDVFLDPVGWIYTDEPGKYYLTAVKWAGKIAKRQRYGDVIDDVLYNSADSYAQMRLMYLQNRHHELGIEADVEDPLQDPYGQQ